MGLIDMLFGRNRRVTFGKQRYKDSPEEKIIVAKSICYTVKDGSMNLHMYDQQDVDDYIKQRRFKPVP